MNTILELRDVSVGYDQSTIVKHVNLALEKGEIGCLLGASGSGKSTLLRAIAGFHPVSEGAISLKGKVIASTSEFVAPEHRHVGMMFQDFALFPHLTVGQNIAFGISDSPEFKTQERRREKVLEMLSLVGLEGFENRSIHALSGGQQQRVALARAIAPQPDLLLLDEPFSSLDTDLRKDLSYQIRDILKQQGISAILVTHDQNEAFSFADKTAVLGEQSVQQWDTAYNLYHMPVNAFVADFIGEGCFIEGTIVDEDKIATALGVLINENHDFEVSSKVNVLLRPDDVLHDDKSPLRAKIVKRDFRGANVMFTLELSQDSVGTEQKGNLHESVEQVLCLANSHHIHSSEDSLAVRIAPEHVIVFAK
ncbi:MAG: ATP-binding cassette domain-containing protein [Alteromonadaceae bacterium]|nr:ATP-binding cassette domain-containing protein [Alteromonadaceae bacterium]